MSLTLLFGLMTFGPAIIAVLFGILSRVSTVRLPALAAMGVAILAAIVPIVGLILLASDLAFPTPLRFAWAGSEATPFAPIFRADGLTAYAAWGIAALITPLLLWIVWMDAGRAEESQGRLLAELALALGLEAVALQLVFSDNLLWLGLIWLVLVALTWLLGEQGTLSGDLDYLGLACALVGPLLTVAAILSVAITAQVHTFYDLMGRNTAGIWQIFLLAIGLTLAGGGYPFAAWVRRRAAFATPSGFAALTLLTLPAVLFVGARAWGALSTNGLWPQIGAVIPPITGGVALALLGTLTVAISGLLALGRRDGRTLVALLATAQVGWGLVALGASQPAAGIGVIVLLATGVAGIGAMIGALVAGGVLTADDEPESAGPVPFGIAPRPLNLLAWSFGAATALGVPFFGGFVARQLITSGTLAGTKLGIPLLGLSWLGDALFAVALIRATVLAFRAASDESDASEVIAESAADAADENEDEDEDEESLVAPAASPAWRAELLELPGVLLALIGLAIGVLPQALLGIGAFFATDQIEPVYVANRTLQIVPFGYATANSQWLPGIFALAALVLGIVVALIRWGVRRTSVTLETTDTTLTGMSSDSLDEPGTVWLDLTPSFTSPWTQVAGKQLIGGIDEDDEFVADLDEEEEDEAEEDSEDEEDEVETDAELAAATAEDGQAADDASDAVTAEPESAATKDTAASKPETPAAPVPNGKADAAPKAPVVNAANKPATAQKQNPTNAANRPNTNKSNKPGAGKSNANKSKSNSNQGRK